MYNPKNWYWVVGGSNSQVYSSARAAYISLTDSTYVEWLAMKNSPTHIDNENNLGDVFSAAGCPQCWYKNAVQILAEETLAAGLNITSTSTPAIDGVYSLSATAQSAYDSVTTYINTKGTFPRVMSTTTWPDITGGLHVFPSTSVFVEFAAAIADFIDAVDDYANGVPGSAIPSNNVTIA